jgi:hypothetical protein
MWGRQDIQESEDRNGPLNRQALFLLGVSTGSIKVYLCGCGSLVSLHSVLPWSLFLQVGDAIPSVEVFEGEPGKKVNLAELFKGKKGVLFGVPGAFTPGCSKVRLLLSRIRNWGPGVWEKRTHIKSDSSD